MGLSDKELGIPESEKASFSDTDLGLPEENKSWSDVGIDALINTPESALRFASDMAQVFIHPVETAQNLGGVLLGTLQLAIPGEQDSEANAKAVGQFFVDRYGSVENLKKTLSDDPVGFLADAATVLTGGGALAARAPGIAGKIGKITQSVGSKVDPINIAGQGAKLATKGVSGLGTHTGAESLQTAFKSGYDDPLPMGDGPGDAFRGQMRGTAPIRMPVTLAKEGLANLRKNRADEYMAYMQRLKANPEIIDFAKIRGAQNKAIMETGRGGIVPKKARGAMGKVEDILAEWENYGPDAHTPYVLDVLKQDLWDLQSKYMERGKKSAGYAYVNKVRRKVRNEISKAAPQYAFYMKKYEQASDLVNEIEGTLSLNPKARVDTSLRKLQAMMRNNVNTSYGHRLELGEILAKNGAKNLIEMIAGQSLSTAFPRGLGPITSVSALGVSLSVSPYFAPFIAAGSSPRLMGEIYHAAGRTTGLARLGLEKAGLGGLDLRPGARGAFQAGRMSGQTPESVSEPQSDDLDQMGLY